MSRKPRVYRRPVYDQILTRAHEPRQFVQVLAGPRQVGKTTLARQVMDAIGVPGHFASADAPDPEDAGWIYTQWAIGRQQARMGGRAGGLLVLDEVQKVRGWSDVVKQLWDEDTAAGIPLRVMLLGSAPLLVRQGLTDSLAGRFEIIRVTHWTFAEMRDAFGWDLDTFLFYGGYPGAAPLIRATSDGSSTSSTRSSRRTSRETSSSSTASRSPGSCASCSALPARARAGSSRTRRCSAA